MNRTDDETRAFIDSIPALAWSASSDGFALSVNRRWLDYTGLTEEAAMGWGWTVAFHPDDLPKVLDIYGNARDIGRPFDVEARLRRADGEHRLFLIRGYPVLDESGKVTWYGTNVDLEDRTRADAQQASEETFRLIVDTTPGLLSVMNAEGGIEFVSRQVLEYFGKTLEELQHWETTDAIHPDDLPHVIAAFRKSMENGTPYEVEHRFRRADGVHRWFQARGLPLRDSEGRVVRWQNLLTDIDDRKHAEAERSTAEEALYKSEERWRAVFENSAIGVALTDISGRFLATNSAYQKMLGYTEEEIRTLTLLELTHEDYRGSNWQLVTALLEDQRSQFQIEKQCRRKDGGLIWVRDNVSLVPGTASMPRFIMALSEDITEQHLASARLEAAFEEIKRLKDRLQDENVALREEIDQAFMFEEIVGASPALRTVLSSVVKVAPTDSTVLISGETGTGKELIARAIHRRSPRSERAFVSVNCAAIPPSLIASELFGHEKGAFTGAMQQRRGRFELAQSGTIFLDEIGEIPLETQVALLRVLQERQIERVGGSRAISIDVRVIAATNRDLSNAISAGTFRSDLFYRLNVFPIQMPPLRQRKDDLPVLVEYFVKRFAEKMAKRISRIDSRTLHLCEAYSWPGNIRELQNIVERSVILCSGDTFSIDEAWLSIQVESANSAAPAKMTRILQDQEKEIIESALAESRGKIAGKGGAAAKLGIPPSTLDSKIKQLKIRKDKFSS